MANLASIGSVRNVARRHITLQPLRRGGIGVHRVPTRRQRDSATEKRIPRALHPCIKPASHFKQCIVHARLIREVVVFHWVEDEVVKFFTLNERLGPPTIAQPVRLTCAIVAVRQHGGGPAIEPTNVLPAMCPYGALRLVRRMVSHFRKQFFVNLTLLTLEDWQKRPSLKPSWVAGSRRCHTLSGTYRDSTALRCTPCLRRRFPRRAE